MAHFAEESRDVDIALAYKLAVVLRGIAENNPTFRLRELSAELRAIAEREASVRREAYEMLEIVTTVIGGGIAGITAALEAAEVSADAVSTRAAAVAVATPC